MKSTLACSLTLLALVATGCQSDGSTAQPTTRASAVQGEPVALGAINELCPVSKNPIDPTVTPVEYDGYQVGFCCAGCAVGWEQMPDRERQAVIDAYTQ